MKYNILSYLIGEGFRNVFKNKKSTGASLTIMCAAMLIFGLFFVIGENVNKIVEDVETQQGMRVFINDIKDSEIDKMENDIKVLDGVNTVTYVSKEDALNEMKTMLKDKQTLLKGYETNNPFPASFVVTLTDLSKSQEVQDNISKMQNIKEITVRNDTINTLINIANWVRIVSAVILVLLVLISIFIIANTIKLTVHVRRKEISIMKYVGATNGFIRAPFVVEGILIGILSALLSVLLLGLAYNATLEKIMQAFSKLGTVDVNLIPFSNMFNLIMVVYLGLGIGIGVIGSMISMKKYLKV